ncbi:MAG TPA: ABC transporter substrate-binding protein [Marmoricola sp.]|jgi:branched-chain amino acid transport system substrate-binding protein|nr:ABC transporter substrate-binding protein [Marmoricola sp.]
MKRRFPAAVSTVAVAATLALAAAACGSSSDSGSSSSTYKIGVLNALTGDLGAVGQQEDQGIELAVSQINAAGGINGKKLSLVKVDDQGSVNLSTAGFKKLATSDKVQAIVGPGISASALAVAPLADQYKVAQVLMVAQPDTVNGTRNVFEAAPPGKSNSEAMVKYAADSGAKSAALIWADNAYGQEGLKDISAATQADGMSLVSNESWDPSKFDFTAQAGKVASENPDVVFLYGAGGTSDATLLKAVRASGYKGKVVGDLSYAASTIPKAAGSASDTAVGLTALGYAAPTAVEKKFIDDFQAKYNSIPTVLSAYAYEAVQLVAAGIKKGGYNGDKIAAAIQGMNFDNGLIGTYDFTKDYHGGPGVSAFKPVSFDSSGNYVKPVF